MRIPQSLIQTAFSAACCLVAFPASAADLLPPQDACKMALGIENDEITERIRRITRDLELARQETERQLLSSSTFTPSARLLNALEQSGISPAAIPEEWRAKLVWAHHNHRLFEIATISNIPRTYAEQMGERYARNDETARTLSLLGHDLGYSAQGHLTLMPNPQWDAFLTDYTVWILGGIRTGRIPQDHALFPGLIFRKKTAVGTSDPKDFVFVRPYLDDSWPSFQEYELIDGHGAQLENPVFLSAILQGIYPFALGQFASHEMGHFTEFRSNPQLMIELVAAVRRQALRPQDTSKTVAQTFRENRYFAINEALTFPNIEKRHELLPLVSHMFVGDGDHIQNPEQEMARLLSLRTPARQTFYENILRRFREDHSLLIRMGGGARDSYNLSNTISLYANNLLLHDLFAQLRLPSDALETEREDVLARIESEISTGQRQLFSESLHGVLAETQILFDILYNGKPVTDIMTWKDMRATSDPRAFVQNTAWVSPTPFGVSRQQLRFVLHRMLAQRVAHFEAAIAAGLLFQITPATVFRESSELQVSRHSSVYRYMSSFVRPESALWAAFLSPNQVAP